MAVLFISSVILFTACCSYGANILATVPTPAYSHQIAFRELWKQLSLRGHKVTVITTDPVNDPTLTNLTELDVKFSYSVFENISNMAENEATMWTFQQEIRPMLKGVAETQLSHEDIQDLIHNRSHQFDLVFAEYFFPEFLAFAEIYKCPKIVFSTLDASIIFHSAVGNTIHPALYPDIMTPFYAPLSFWERVKNTLFMWNLLYYIHHYTYYDKDQAIQKFFKLPITTAELIDDTDMLFLNINPVINNIRAVGPSTIFVGDIRKENTSQSLSKLGEWKLYCGFQDLKDYLDSAEAGFIYFSLGSNVKSKELKKDSLISIMEALGEMPYKVVWKFEDDHLPGKPDNVKLVKWAPQLAVLGKKPILMDQSGSKFYRHPNIKVFVTQGGLQSMEEGIFNEVPFVVIPFFGDQDQNALLMKSKGIGMVVERHPFIRKENLKKAMLEVINNPSYRNAVKKLKQIALDVPMTGIEKAIWWTEYVIRNNGAKHLRNPAADLPFYQYYLIDVIGFLAVIFSGTLYLVVYSIKKILILYKALAIITPSRTKKVQ